MRRVRILLAAAVLVPALAASASTATNLPASLELRYVLRYGGLTVGHVTKTLTREPDGRYRQRSHSRPEGMARLFTRVEWFEEGRFEVVQGRVRPLEFLEHRVGADKSHRHEAVFDWQAGKIRYAHGPVVDLPPDTQDQGSILYALMLDPPPPGRREDIHISSGKKLVAYRYERVGSETLQTPLGALKTHVIERLPLGKDDEVFRIWLAAERDNLPVRILTRKRGQDTVLELESVAGL